jgi:hypothetical protein
MFLRHDGVLRAGTRHIGMREALKLGHGGGTLRVLAGSLWLTRTGDGADYFLSPGQCFEPAPGECVVIESARAGDRTIVDWRPDRLPLHARVALGIARVVAGHAMFAKGVP